MPPAGKPLLVSIHVPKTGGMSFQRTLEAHFGDRFRRDDADRPANTGPLRRRLRALRAALALARDGLAGVDCVHGHFLAAKWLLLARRRPVTFVTWLRDPVERLASHYHYWRRSYDPATALPLHRRAVEEDWTFERFALGPELRDLATELLWRLPRERLAFVGLTETYEADHAAFCRRILGIARPPTTENVNPEAAPDPYVADPALRRRIAEHHRQDVELYAWAKSTGR
ncbi:MAG: sulfotransferase family protein [Acidobacteriota bacterium]|nr:sulfotransferase family protein [Acidobacteriota bacterium]MDH3522739.1 sulfotransferase family protein [Acidobacteriota bacterium]